jgi:transposase
MKRISIMGIDLAKAVFQLHGTDAQGKMVFQKKLRRSELKEFIVKLSPCLIGMEACGGSHYWAREFEKMGHTVRLISPQFVKPYVKSNKNDAADAEAIAEALSRPSMRFVPIKPIANQDIQCLHRIRARLVRNRTALSNEIRGFLCEYGIVLPKSVRQLRMQVPLILEDATNELSSMARDLFAGLLEELKNVEDQITKYDRKIGEIYKKHEVCQRIGKIEGVGPITATAILAAVSDAQVFKNGRQFSAWLGLVPKQHSSGGKTTLLGISKRGDRYLRSLLIHGARTVVTYAKRKKDDRSRWITEKEKTRGFNKACVAVANKNARIIWALIAHGTEYRKAA